MWCIVVAILAAVAYPSFTNGLQSPVAPEALKGLLSMQLKREEFPAYPMPVMAGRHPKQGASDYYTFTISGATATVYALIATRQRQSGNDAGCTILDPQQGRRY